MASLFSNSPRDQVIFFYFFPWFHQHWTPVHLTSPRPFLPTERVPPPGLPTCSGATQLGQQRHSWDTAITLNLLRSLPSRVSRDEVMCSLLHGEQKVLVGACSESWLLWKATSGFNKSWLCCHVDPTSVVSYPFWHTWSLIHPTGRLSLHLGFRHWNEMGRYKPGPLSLASS